jgi:hypothetical protein
MNAILWRKSLAYLLTAVGLAALTAAPGMAQRQDQQQTGDPVADAARKAREQKKKETAKPKRVYTDDDLNHAVPDATPSSTEKSADGAKDATPKSGTDQANAAAGPETDKDREAKWRKRFKDAYGKLAQAEKELDILQREDNKAQVQYYSDPQKAMQEQYSRKDINEKNSKIDAKKKEVAQLKQQIGDLQDDLRKDGGDPGWAAP